MKRTLIIVLALVLSLAAGAFIARAQSDVAIFWKSQGVAVTQKTVAVDDVFYLNVWLDASAPVSAMDFHLGWDADVLELVSTQPLTFDAFIVSYIGAGTWDAGAYKLGAGVPAGNYRVAKLEFRAVGAGETTIAPPGAYGTDWLVAAPGGVELSCGYAPVTVTVTE